MIIFVYGTLKQGFRAHEMLKESEYLGQIFTAPYYALFSRITYPCMVFAEYDGYQISGEIYQVDYETLRKLNQYECTGSGLYSLEVISLDKTSLYNNKKEMDVEYSLGYIYLGDISRMTKIKAWDKVIPDVYREDRI